jgi:hypothetical protein
MLSFQIACNCIPFLMSWVDGRFRVSVKTVIGSTGYVIDLLFSFAQQLFLQHFVHGPSVWNVIFSVLSFCNLFWKSLLHLGRSQKKQPTLGPPWVDRLSLHHRRVIALISNRNRPNSSQRSFEILFSQSFELSFPCSICS